jgi:uncharacterized membrane protein
MATMLYYAVAYLVTLLLFVGIDLVWLTWVGGPIYRQFLGDMLLPGVRIPPALAFYLIYPLGLVMFAVHPGLNGGSILGALLAGALFGFFTYATYDLTNFATLRNWNLVVTVMDIGWGCLLGAATAAGSVALTGALGSLLRLSG